MPIRVNKRFVCMLYIYIYIHKVIFSDYFEYSAVYCSWEVSLAFRRRLAIAIFATIQYLSAFYSHLEIGSLSAKYKIRPVRLMNKSDDAQTIFKRIQMNLTCFFLSFVCSVRMTTLKL